MKIFCEPTKQKCTKRPRGLKNNNHPISKKKQKERKTTGQSKAKKEAWETGPNSKLQLVKNEKEPATGDKTNLHKFPKQSPQLKITPGLRKLTYSSGADKDRLKLNSG